MLRIDDTEDIEVNLNSIKTCIIRIKSILYDYKNIKDL